jgi:hypothetical protein
VRIITINYASGFLATEQSRQGRKDKSSETKHVSHMGKKCTGRNTQKKRTTWKEDNINMDIYATGWEREVWKGLISQRTRTVTRLL